MQVDWIAAIKEVGLPVCLVAYFLVKDWKFSDNMLGLMGRVEHLLTVLEGNENKEVK